MESTPHSVPADEQVFQLAATSGRGSLLWLVAGIGLLVAGVVGFVVAAMTRVDQLTLHLVSTMPCILGIGALSTAWATARSAHAVSVDSRGLAITYRQAAQRFGWDEIGWAATQPLVMNSARRQMKVYGTDGRLVAKLSDAIENFDVMAALIESRIAVKEDGTADRLLLKKARRMAVLTFLGGIAFTGLTIAFVWMVREEGRTQRLLQEQGVPGVARIEERRLAPNGITPRLIYQVTGANGETATRNAEVFRDFWDALEGEKTVDVVYVPSEPAISRLLIGEPEDNDMFKRPPAGYVLAGLGAVIALFFFGTSMLSWKGLDIGFDKNIGRFVLKRFGERVG